MDIDKEKIIQRIDGLINLAASSMRDFRSGGEVISGTINILEALYGANSNKCKAYMNLYQCYMKEQNKLPRLREIVSSTSGVLKSIKDEIESDLVGNLERQARGGIFGDFITLARKSLDESKDVAAVLVSAALEDALKRFAQQHGLNVADAEMAQVINALKSKGLLKDPQASIVQGHANLRNKAFHANWERIEKESVSSAIGFTETFVLEHFS